MKRPETSCLTPEFIASYAHVWEPKATLDGEEKYSVSMVFPKGTDLAKMKKCAELAAVKKWGKERAKELMGMSSFKWPFRDGADRPKDQAYRDSTFVNASSKTRVGVTKPEGGQAVPILDQFEFYSGCIAVASVNFFAFDRSGSKGVGCGLNNLLKMRDGDRLGGPAPAAEDFAEYTSSLDYDDVDPLG